MEQLKVVKRAMKKALKIARILVLEKAYYIFIQADIKRLRSKPDEEDVVSPFLLQKHLERDFIVV